MEIPSVSTLVELLKYRVSTNPDSLAYQFFYDENLNYKSINYEKLDKLANEIAQTLLTHGLKKGDRALLIYHPGLDFVCSLFGCLYAGIVAIPLYPPTNLKLEDKINLILSDSTPSLILTDTKIQNEFQAVLNRLNHNDYIFTDTLGERSEFFPIDIDAETLAYLQYTSGSTSDPKGVKITHRNLIDNVSLLADVFSDIQNSVSWLPPYHDMGLLTGIILPLALGIPARLLSPNHFLINPIDWLKIISQFEKVYSVAPNFAYGLCAEKITDKEKKSLNLEQWLLACNGAEPVRMHTIDTFYHEFAACGFKKEVFCPCYGLAEATLLVSLNNEFTKFPGLDVSSEALKLNKIAFDYHDETTKIINVGKMYQPTKIVDPNTLIELNENHIGEIWIHGDSVSSGYWNNKEETIKTFKAHIADDTSKINYLRTGDLGFKHNNNLYITGRIKDLIILHGKNYYPHDLELIVEQAHPLIRKNCLVSFSIEKNKEEHLVLVCETEPVDNDEWPMLIASICNSLFEEMYITPSIIVFIPPKHLPKTTSGKVQRQITKKLFNSGGLKINHLWEQTSHNGQQNKNSTNIELQKSELVTWILDWIKQHITKSSSLISANKSYAEYGFDSINLANFIGDFNTHTGLLIDSLLVINYPTPQQLAEFVIKNKKGLPKLYKITPRKNAKPVLSLTQERLLYLQMLHIKEPILNIGAAFKMTGYINVEKFKSICNLIIKRHEILHTAFNEKLDKDNPRLIDKLPEVVQVIEASKYTDPELKEEFIQETLKTYNFTKGPLFRLSLYKISDKEAYLLIAAHHIIFDSWSLMLFVKELITKYEDEAATLPVLPIQYYDFANWQKNQSKEHQSYEVLDFWAEYLKNAPLKLTLPIDHRRNKKHIDVIKYYKFNLEESIGDNVSSFCKEEGITSFILFFTTFQVLLTHYSNQKDFLIGVPVNGRIIPETTNLIGLFVKPLPIRVRISSSQHISSLLQHNQRMLNKCFRFQDIPLPQLAQRLNLDKNLLLNPLFRVTFIMQNINPEEVVSDTISCSLFWSESGLFPYDLTLEVIPRKKEGKEIYEIILKYDEALFNASTITKFEEHFECLLNGVMKHPSMPVLEVPFITTEEKNKLLFEWNSTEIEYPNEKTLHALFEEQVEKNLTQIALNINDEVITYQELNEKANQLAHYLLDHTLHEEEIIAILQKERSIDLIISMLAVLKAGGAFLLINPDHFEGDITKIQQKAKIRIILTTFNWKDYITYPTYNPDVAKNTSALAYTVYKKDPENENIVLIEHQNICDRLHWYLNNSIDFKEFIHLFSFEFDDAIAALFWPLLKGATVYLPDLNTIDNKLLDIIINKDANVFYSTPGLLTSLLSYVKNNDFQHMKYVILAKELFKGDFLDKIKEVFPEDVKIMNTYGVAEGTIISTLGTVNDKNLDILPIGSPISNTEIFVLNEQKNLVPIGIIGELYIGGKGVARGYLDNKLLEKQKFISNPFSTPLSNKLYRTGDFVRMTIEGELIFIKHDPS